jgi:hypothetical protein
MSPMSEIFIRTSFLLSEYAGAYLFDQEVRIDLMWIDRNEALHIVDAGTAFIAARFLSGQDVATVWNFFLEAWTTLYTGHPQSILTDHGSVFLAAEWCNACILASTSLRHTGTEIHNSLGAGERFCGPLRRI